MRASVAVTSHGLVSQEEQWCPIASLSAFDIAAAVVVPSLRGLRWCAGIKQTESQFLNPVSYVTNLLTSLNSVVDPSHVLKHL